MGSKKEQEIKHLLWRAGFGPDAKTWPKVRKQSPQQVLKQLMKDSLVRPLTSSDKLINGGEEMDMRNIQEMSVDQRKELQMTKRMLVRSVNVDWVRRMATNRGQVREKMMLFWHDHFACRIQNPRLVQIQQQTLRSHALGNFGDLLRAISRDPAMLQFLNNQQNRKRHPNENFARELLELFTLGRGHYTEKDIQEAARAFTGWGFNRKGEFIFRARQHDTGMKTFMGRSGKFGGEDVLTIVLENKRTAYYITEKLYRYLVHPEPVEEVIQDWAEAFYQSGYDISSLLQNIFSSDHFYEKRNIGARIKSPIEYMVGMMRNLSMKIRKDEGILMIEKALDQVLLQPPNVAGWPDGRNWINGTSLLLRMKLPQALILGQEVSMAAKANFAGNEDGIQIQGRLARQLRTDIDWSILNRQVKKQSDQEIVDTMRDYFLQVDSPHLDHAFLKPYISQKDRDTQFKILCMRLICTPEYQLC